MNGSAPDVRAFIRGGGPPASKSEPK